MTLSCNNYYCIGYKENTCKRGIEHKLKLYNKRLDDNHIDVRNNTELCDLFLGVKK